MSLSEDGEHSFTRSGSLDGLQRPAKSHGCSDLLTNPLKDNFNRAAAPLLGNRMTLLLIAALILQCCCSNVWAANNLQEINLPSGLRQTGNKKDNTEMPVSI